MAENEPGGTPPEPLLEAIANLARFHHEHEKYYSQAPLRQAAELQARSRALKSPAGRWSTVDAGGRSGTVPFAGAEDLNAPGLAAEPGIPFLEGAGEPAELLRLKRDIGEIAGDYEQGGTRLAHAMEQAWEIAGQLAVPPAPARPAR